MCNLSEIVHNVWLQQFGKRGACLYVVILDDYVQAFKQSTIYFISSRVVDQVKGLIRVSCFCRTTQFGDLKQLVDIVLKYSMGLACIIRITHMEGEEIFGSCK
jgi:hypothetical protein